MTEVNLCGVPVRFPFDPYEVQNTYMTKVLECLQNGVNGILESPTGTGKTLCLLCSSLAWLETTKARWSAMRHQSEESSNPLNAMLAEGVGKSWLNPRALPPQIIYSSRTHSQLSQAISEMKRTTYKYMKVSVIGSRDQMCVHPTVSKETNNNTKVTMCQMKVKGKTCHYYNQVERSKDIPEVRSDVHDIEDLVKLGKQRSFCPYYIARELKKDADIIFMPYNYLVDPKARKAHGVDLQGNIVIFDEAHNIEKMCEESASCQFSSTDLALCIDDVTQVMKKVQEESDEASAAASLVDSSQGLLADFSPEDLYTLKALFLELEKAIDNIQLPTNGSGVTHPGDFMFSLMEKADITPSKKTIIAELLEKLVQYLTANSSSPFQRKGLGLQKFLELIYIVYSREHYSEQQMNFVKRSYKVHVNIEEPKKKGNQQDGWNAPKQTITTKTGRLISFWCFHPGFGMRALVEQGVKCILLTSGTLAPLSSFASELQIPFPVTLENPHVIQRNQVWAGVICNGPDGTDLNSSFRTRSDPKYKRSLGQTILNLSRVIPDGLLVFFPSYSILRDCQETWQNTGVWGKLSERKPIFVEPRMKDEFLSAMQEYYDKINDPAFKGACFMAVCRGKVSEGLDFANRNGRAVIITGLPYPPFKDPRVVLKQKYLDESRSTRESGLTGQAWYHLEASRAVNQAVGRVIRHKDDFGAIILCDKRFAGLHFKNEMSAWVRPYIINYNNFGHVMRDVTQFFKQKQVLVPAPEPKSEESIPSNTSESSSCITHNVVSRPKAFKNTSKHSLEAENTEVPNENVFTLYQPHLQTDNSAERMKAKDVPERKNKSIFELFDKGEVKYEEDIYIPAPTVHKYIAPETNKRKKIKLAPRNVLPPVGNMNFSDNASKPPNSIGSVPSGSLQTNDKGEVHHPTKLEGNAVKTETGKEAAIKEKLKTTEAYIKEVKATISKEKYSMFSSAIKEYKTKKDFEKLMTVIPSVFSDVPTQQSLMKKFSRFLNPEDKDKFKAFTMNSS